jgi:integrase
MKKKLASLPQIKVSKGTWFVYFSVINPKTNKLKPIKIYQGFINCKNDDERLLWGKKLIGEYTEKLKTGWSPLFDCDKYIYSDQLEYQNFTERFKKFRKATKNIRFYLNEFLNIKKQGLKPKTYSTYVSKLRIFCNWIDFKGFAEYDITEIRHKIILEFFSFLIDDRKLDKTSIGKYKQILFSYFEYIKKKELIAENPVYDIVKPPKTKDMAARPITKRDLQMLLKLILESDPQLYLACMFQYYLALRPGQELRKLKINDIDLYNNRVVVTDENAKKVRRTVDMSEDLVELCHHFNLHCYNCDFYVFGKDRTPGTSLLGQNTLRNRFNKYRDMLNLPKTYKFYSMKHTGGGMLLESGLTLEELRAHMGHTSILSTDHYVKKHFGNRNQKVIKSFPKPF